MSVLSAVVGPLGGFLLLTPDAVLSRFFLWQLATWGLVGTTAGSTIFGGLIIWSIGGSLESLWGRKRLGRFCLGVTVVSGLLATLLSLPSSALRLQTFVAGSALPAALWVAYGLTLGRQMTNFWGMPVSGNVLAGIGAGFVLLSLAFSMGGWWQFVPEVLALALTYLSSRVESGSLWTRFRAWQFERDLKKRSAHLQSLDGGKKQPRGSDKYLH